MGPGVAPLSALDARIWAAIITAAASLLVAAWSLYLAHRSTAAARDQAKLNHTMQAELAKLTSALESERDAGKARRDYEYVARKRLYAECEPLLFQALELSRT